MSGFGLYFFNTRIVMRECTAYSPSFSIQPCINKFGGAISSGIVSFIVIISGIKEADTATDVKKEGLFIMKKAMLVFQLICILAGYIVNHLRYKIDKKLLYDRLSLI